VKLFEFSLSPEGEQLQINVEDNAAGIVSGVIDGSKSKDIKEVDLYAEVRTVSDAEAIYEDSKFTAGAKGLYICSIIKSVP
jgi:hypothetical protein